MPLCYCKSELINPVTAELAPCEVSLGLSVLAFPDQAYTVALDYM